ncbi:type III secretion system stator protein SctL [Glaciimonas sp. GG7]
MRIDPTARILRVKDLGVRYDAEAILFEAQEEAHKILEHARQEREAECRAGYAEGLAKAQGEQAREMAKLAQAHVLVLKSTERELMRLSLAIAETLIGDIPRGEQVSRLVHQALAQLIDEKGGVTVYVHPAHMEEVTARLADLYGMVSPMPIVMSDSKLDQDACRIITASGNVEGSLTHQLAAVAEAFEQSRT